MYRTASGFSAISKSSANRDRCRRCRIGTTLALSTIITLMAIAAPGLPQPDHIRLAPPTGVYVETDHEAEQPDARCDWYASASELVEATAGPAYKWHMNCHVVVRIRGVLNHAGAERFAEVTEFLGSTDSVPTRLVLNSRGGDALAAFRFADIVRSNPLYQRIDGGVTTEIDASHTAVCFSACLIVFASGYERRAEFNIGGDPSLPSRLGIHSPGQFDRQLSAYDTREDNRNIRQVRAQLVHYFRSVDVSEQIVDDMFAIPFEQIRLLTHSEAVAYRLVSPDEP